MKRSLRNKSSVGSLLKQSLDSSLSASPHSSRMPSAQPTSSCSCRSARCALPFTNRDASAAAPGFPGFDRFPASAEALVQRDIWRRSQHCDTSPPARTPCASDRRARFNSASQSVRVSDCPNPPRRRSGCGKKERQRPCRTQCCCHASVGPGATSFSWANQASSTLRTLLELCSGEISLNRIKARS